jgi:hypothetical protein
LGGTEMAFVVLGALVGIACALRRYAVFVLLPASALLAASTLLSGAAFHNHSGVIVVEVLAAVAALQFAYIAVRLIYSRARSIGLTRQTQTAIGQQLNVYLELPQRLSPELFALVARLKRV